jgi:hypothetical protein
MATNCREFLSLSPSAGEGLGESAPTDGASDSYSFPKTGKFIPQVPQFVPQVLTLISQVLIFIPQVLIFFD